MEPPFPFVQSSGRAVEYKKYVSMLVNYLRRSFEKGSV